jgi:uncharacterized protein
MDSISQILLIIGGINWGLVGLLDMNLVSTIFGDMTTISRVIYAAVGLSGLYALAHMCKMCKSCK